MAQIPAIFPSLAVEIIELITDSMEGQSLLQLRLACRDLQRKTFNCFARRFFTSIRTDLSDASLARIHLLSQHQALRPYVKGLAFMLQNGMGRGLSLTRHSWGPLSAPMEVEEIQRFRDNLLNGLTNCRPEMSHVTVTDAVAVFFALLVDARLPVSSFHLIYANKHSRTLVMDMRRIPKMLCRQPRFQAVWSNLQTLSLEQYLTLDNFGFLLELVLSATNLQTLLLNLGSHDLACEFMHELAETAKFSKLRELALFRTAIKASDLQRLLESLHTTLTTLTLYHVCLAPEGSWAPVLQDLSCDCTLLRRISLHYLWASSPAKGLLEFPDLRKSSAVCEAADQRLQMFYSENKAHAVLGVGYSGADMSRILTLLQKTVATT
ncbi:hypothetical protein N7470_006530 [Penicillium chermesinum]|nr:hypothetical protein N7470_006530 [Penicillium chermesinum]